MIDHKTFVKTIEHALDQAEKHIKMASANPSDKEYHLDSIALLLADANKTLGIPQPTVRAPSEPDPEELWRQQLFEPPK